METPAFITNDVTQWIIDAADWLSAQSDFALIVVTLPAIVISLLMFVGWAVLASVLLAAFAIAVMLVPLAVLEFLPAAAIVGGFVVALAAISARVRRSRTAHRIRALEDRILRLEAVEQGRVVSARTWEPPA